MYVILPEYSHWNLQIPAAARGRLSDEETETKTKIKNTVLYSPYSLRGSSLLCLHRGWI